MGIKKWQRLRTDGGRDSGDKGTKPTKSMSKTSPIIDMRLTNSCNPFMPFGMNSHTQKLVNTTPVTGFYSLDNQIDHGDHNEVLNNCSD